MSHDSTPLAGRVAVVTGGSRGIGRAIAEALAEAGADVVPTARTEADVEDAVAAVRERGADSLAVTTDVAEAGSVEALFESVEDAFGRLDVLVNNAGINPMSAIGRPAEVEREAFGALLEVNVRGAFDCAQAAEELLHADGGGNVVNVASILGLVGSPRQHPYTATKHALVGLTRSLALEWAPDVRVNAVAPGYVSTDLTTAIEENERLYRSMLEKTPLGRFAEPEEVAEAALFLASDRASFVTGSVLTVDGGWTAR